MKTLINSLYKLALVGVPNSSLIFEYVNKSVSDEKKIAQESYKIKKEMEKEYKIRSVIIILI